MDQRYPVTLNGTHVGEVSIASQGLYYHITCRCKTPRKEIYTLYADGEALGILVPDGGMFSLVTNIPQKRFSEKAFVFYLMAKNEQQSTEWIPIRSGEPFDYLHRLKEARFSADEQDGMIGLPTISSHL